LYKTSPLSEIYRLGVRSFITAAEANCLKKGSSLISCPCTVCKNFKYYNGTEEIEFHLLRNGFMPRYHCWSRHGESIVDFSTSSTPLNIYNDTTYNNDSLDLDDRYEHDDHSIDPNDNLNEMLHDMETNMGDSEKENLQHLFQDAEKPLYTGSKFNKLDVVLKLFKLKSNNGWSDKSFTKLLVLLHDMLPEDNELPISTYQAKKMMCPMGLEVERIHACPNNCILYRKEHANKHKCVLCGASRYKRIKDSDELDDDVTKNGPPAKMLWYLPIIPRLKRLFSDETEA
jgi:ferredoxin-like protein FixX